MTIKISTKNNQGIFKTFFYDQHKSTLVDESGKSLIPLKSADFKLPKAEQVHPSSPGKKSRDLKLIKIQLGLNCNYSCDYCSQKYVPRAESTNKNDVDEFVKKIERVLDKNARVKFEFWGGEPLVYWKTLQPLAEKLKSIYSFAEFSIVTNGSLLNQEINDWLVENQFDVGISHDGPGQSFRGTDPLDSNPFILDLFDRLQQHGKISLNAMMHKNSFDRDKTLEWFKTITNSESVPIGEGGFIDAYDEDGFSLLVEEKDHFYVRSKLYTDLCKNILQNYTNLNQKFLKFVFSISYGITSDTLSQKCGMDLPGSIAVDLNGNLLTCQNVSAKSTTESGASHKIGTLDDIENAKLNTAHHWSTRKLCNDCPVLQLCQGSCMFLTGDKYSKSCDTSYDDNIAMLSYIITYFSGGFKPFRLEGANIPEDRKNIFGEGLKIKKPFPIPVKTELI